MPVYKIDTNQGSFNIDANRQPTPEEAMAYINKQSSPTPTATQLPIPTPEAPSLMDRTGDAVVNQLGDTYNAIANPVSALFTGLGAGAGNATGAIENAAAQPTLQGKIAELLKGYGTGAQSTSQGLSNLLFHTLGQLQQKGQAMQQNPILESIPGPVGTLVRALSNQPQAPQQPIISAPTLPEIFGKSNPDIAGPVETLAPFVAGGIAAPAEAGTALTELPKVPGRAVSGIARTIAPNVMARVAPATVEQSAMSALDFNKAQVAEHIPVVTQRVSELVGKVPKTAEEAISAMKQAEAQLYDERLTVNDAATKQGLAPSGNTALQAARDTLEPLTTLTDAEKSTILQRLDDLYSNKNSMAEGQRVQQDLNKKFSAAYENGTIDKADPKFQAELAIRDSFANQMDEIGKAVTGLNESPYSDIGSLIETRGTLADKLGKLEGREAGKKTGIETPPANIPLTPHGVKAEAVKTAIGKNPLRKTQIEKLNQNVQRIFKESPKQEPAPLLPTEILPQLRAQYAAPRELPPPLPNQPIPIVPSVPVAPVIPDLTQFIQNSLLSRAAPAVEVAAPSLDAQIQASMEKIAKQYPQLSPDVVRQVAIQDLAGQAAPQRPRYLTGEANYRNQPPQPVASAPVEPLQQAVQQSVQAQPVTAPETLPVKTYPPEIQAKLDKATADYQNTVDFYKRQPGVDPETLGRNLKGAGMRYAAEKRQITGKLTGREFKLAAKKAASNFIGKPVQVNIGGQLVDAKVTGNPFGRVKVKLADGREMTVLPENIQ